MTARRLVIKIDENQCNGCAACIPNCPEGAIQIIDNKARLISDRFCDGLGACLGHCPRGAITLEEREAHPYNEPEVMKNIVLQGPATIQAHLEHLQAHGENGLYQEAVAVLKARGLPMPIAPRKGGLVVHACPGMKAGEFKPEAGMVSNEGASPRSTQLRNWPIQLMLAPVSAPYYHQADLAVTADCVGFSHPDFHSQCLAGRVLLIACPKLDNIQVYLEKLTEIFRQNHIRSVAVYHMEVPCCFGLARMVEQAMKQSGRDIPIKALVVSLQGEMKKNDDVELV